MKILVIPFLSFVLLFNCATAQKENYNWYFGNKAGITFNTPTPTALTNSAMTTTEGCATISDQNGSLLFYTNGIKVWNRNHVKMPSGDSLGGGNSSTQSALIIPVPETFGIFYIFTVQHLNDPQPTYFRYSVVDMALDTGRGDISVKNVALNDSVTEKMCAVKHANGYDTWVMIHGYKSRDFYAYLISSAGITGPVVSVLGDSLSGAKGVGQMKFSPDGTKFAHAQAVTNVVMLFDFDASTGVLTNEKRLPIPWTPHPQGLYAGVYGLEFSSSANLLYASTDTTSSVYQWDITSNNETIINSTFQKIGTLTGNGGALQLGPDGKIYAAAYGSGYLGVINIPELPGTACNFVANGISLSPKTSTFGLPNFISTPFQLTGIKKAEPKISVSLYPNPAKDKLTIAINAQKSTSLNLFLRDITGRIVLERTFSAVVGENKMEMDVSRIAKGVYFLNTDSASLVAKVMVE